MSLKALAVAAWERKDLKVLRGALERQEEALLQALRTLPSPFSDGPHPLKAVTRADLFAYRHQFGYALVVAVVDGLTFAGPASNFVREGDLCPGAAYLWKPNTHYSRQDPLQKEGWRGLSTFEDLGNILRGEEVLPPALRTDSLTPLDEVYAELGGRLAGLSSISTVVQSEP